MLNLLLGITDCLASSKDTTEAETQPEVGGETQPEIINDTDGTRNNYERRNSYAELTRWETRNRAEMR